MSEDEKRVRKLEDNYLTMQQKQDEILDKIKELKECTITKNEMDLANERLIERVFKKVEENFARKTEVENARDEMEDIRKRLNKTLGVAGGISLAAIIYIIKKAIDALIKIM